MKIAGTITPPNTCRVKVLRVNMLFNSFCFDCFMNKDNRVGSYDHRKLNKKYEIATRSIYV